MTASSSDPTHTFDTVLEEDEDEPRELELQGSVAVTGRFLGTLRTSGDLYVAPGAHVEADVVAEHVCVEGVLEGSICARGTLALKAAAIVKAKIVAANLHVEEGAQLDGWCEVGD